MRYSRIIPQFRLGQTILLGVILSLLGGCNIHKQMVELSQARHYQPKAMRHQIFRNTPTARPASQDQGWLQEKASPQMRYLGYGQPVDYYGVDSKEGAGYDSYGAGFEAGCDVFSGTMGEGSMRLIKPKFDVDRLTNDQWYLRGYQDAASFCTFSIDWETH